MSIDSTILASQVSQPSVWLALLWRHALTSAVRPRLPALTTDQLELLHRARDGFPIWGGSVAIDRLRRDVDLLLALRLVEPAGATPYRLTTLGATVLGAVSRRPS